MNPDTAQKLGDLAQRADKQRRRFYARLPKPVDSILSQVIAKRGYAAASAATELAEAWSTAAGEAIATHTQVVGLRRGQFEVIVANSTMMQEINFHRPRLLKAIQEAIPSARITALKLKVGRIR
jgi:predicted nucleic acid-binding Zn ribbon protein